MKGNGKGIGAIDKSVDCAILIEMLINRQSDGRRETLGDEPNFKRDCMRVVCRGIYMI
jgi:hypothetical protein